MSSTPRLLRIIRSSWALGVVIMVSFPSVGHAQRFGRFEDTETNVAAYYHFVQPGKPTIQVHVFGAATFPGLYEVNAETPFGTVLTFARPQITTGGRSPRTLDLGDIEIRLLRHGSANDGLVFKASLQQVMMNPDENPVLQDGDVVTIQAGGGSVDWRDVLSVVQSVAIFSLAVWRFSRIF